jgi:peptide-methionine (R)-S-oxide reductase
LSPAKPGYDRGVEDTTLAMSVARSRIALGVAAVVTPGVATRIMGGRRGSGGIAPLFARMLGARDIALGLGTVIALDRGKPVRGWLEGSALADTMDCVACVLAREDMAPSAFGVAAGLGAASAILGVFLSRRLDPPPPPHPGQPEAVATGHSPEPITDQ